MDRTILHIDFDSFFASVEQQYNVSLRGRPIGVTATNGRTCIIAASRQAKCMGIRTPGNTYKAKIRCPSIVFVPADFIKYWEISKKFLAIAKDYSPTVELFSIDEVFIDITKTAHLFGGVESIISQIKQRINQDIGEYITVSVGISCNKLLAKLASGLQKPNGIVRITPFDVEHIYKTAELTDVCGIGNRIAKRLNAIGIYSLWQLRSASLTFLISEFGNAEGRFLKNIGMAQDDSEVISYTEEPDVKSVGRNYCLPQNEYDQRVVLQNVYELCEEVGIKLRRLGQKAKTISFSLRGSRNMHQSKTIWKYIDSGNDIFQVCKYLYNEWQWQEMVRMISVSVSNLTPNTAVPLTLFDTTPKSKRLLQTIDSLNEKFGDHTVRNGFLLYAQKLTTVPNGYMADKYERIKLAKESSLAT